MSKRPKYHFLTIIRRSGGGTSVVALPGQTFGRKSVPERILVKEIGGGTAVARCRRNGKPGDVFFTTTLQNGGSCLKLRDIHPLSVADTDVLYSDAADAYQDYLRSLSVTQ